MQDKASPVDTINGFIEVYLDARGIKGAWEALVFYVNREKTSEIQKIAPNAQWFEDRMPWDPKYRKQGVQGVTANAIDVVIETGDSGPDHAGRHQPAERPEVRERYGSKSVSLSNVNEAYDKSTLPEFRSEFSWTPEEAARATKWSAFAGELTTNMHEVIGHASGKVAERLNGQSAGGAQGAVLGARGGAGRSGGALFPAGSEARRARARLRRRIRTRSCAPNTRLRAQRARAAAPRARRARRSKKTTCATAR